MSDYMPWSWTESLGGLRPDSRQSFRVRRILLGLVQDRCREMGLKEGQEFRCRDRTGDQVVVEFPGGTLRNLELPYAWFIQVEPVGQDVAHAVT
jgi:hypothetical protein